MNYTMHHHRYVSIQSQLCVCLGVVRIHLKCCSFEWIAGNTSASHQQLDKGNLLHRPVPLGSPWPLYKNP